MGQEQSAGQDEQIFIQIDDVIAEYQAIIAGLTQENIRFKLVEKEYSKRLAESNAKIQELAAQISKSVETNAKKEK